MITGLYPHAHGITENDGRFGGRAGLEPQDKLAHHELQNAGYELGWFGKWHVDNRRSAAAYGFSGFSLPGYGYPYSTDEYENYLNCRGLQKPCVTVEIAGESGKPAGHRVALTEAERWFDYEAGAARLDGCVESHEAFFLSDLATRWLSDRRGEPFFLRVDPWGPHPAYVTAPPFHGMLDDAPLCLPKNFYSSLADRPQHHRDYRDYWTQTLSLDVDGWVHLQQRALEHCALVEAALLRIVDAIDELGLSDNTYVIFTADHGDAVASNGGVANKGGLMVEETMRIPLLVRGPGIVPATSCDSLVSNLDLGPTVLDLCGQPVHEGMHGHSLVPLLKPDAGRFSRPGLMTQHYGLHEPIVQRAYYERELKLVVQQDGFVELYNLTADPHEVSNLAQDAGSARTLRRLRDALSRRMHAVGDTGLGTENIAGH